MERCVWIFPDEDLPNGDYDRIFIGDESCGGLLASEALLRQIDAVLNAGKRAGVVVPYLTPEREASLAHLLENLPPSADVVVNDVGAFWMVRQRGRTPIIGRLLARQNTDPAILSFYKSHPGRIVYHGRGRAVLEHAPPSESLTAHLTGSPLFSPETAALFLAGCERMTVMLDYLPHGMPKSIPARCSVLLNTNSVLVSVLPCRLCTECPGEEVLLGRTRANVPIYRRKNICYYKRSDISVAAPSIPGYVSGLILR